MTNKSDSTANLGEIWESISPLLDDGKSVRLRVSGCSMQPLLMHGRDFVLLKKSEKRLKKYDLPLYRRIDGTVVLHRIIGVKKEGFICAGDAQTEKEYPVKNEQILAVAVAFERKGKFVSVESFKYKFYARLWVFLRPFRHKIFALIRILKKHET